MPALAAAPAHVAPRVGFVVDTTQRWATCHAGAALERTFGSLAARHAVASLSYPREPGLGAVLIAFSSGEGGPESGVVLTPAPSRHAQTGVTAHLCLALARLAAQDDVPSLAVAEAALALRLSHAEGSEAVSKLTPTGHLSPWQIKRATQYVEERIGLPLVTAELAAACRVCESHFVRAFRATLGISPWQWVIRCRVQRAQALLVESSLCLSEIALTCGFAAQSHFTRTFTKLVGVPPGGWRRRYQAETPTA